MHDLVGGFTLDALHRRDATCLQKRHLRSILHHCRFSRPRPVSSIGHNNRQQIDPDMQVLGRYILSAIYSALSVHVFVLRNGLFTFGQTWQVALCVYAWNILVAYLCLKLYDEPVRKYLAKRFSDRGKKQK